MKKSTSTTENAKANLSAKNDSVIAKSINRERKYLIPYESLSTNEQKKVRGKIREKLFSFVNAFVIASKGSNKERMESIRKEFAEFAKATYVNPDWKDSSVFFNGTGRNAEVKRMELESLLSAMQKG